MEDMNGERNPNPDPENGFGLRKPEIPDGFVLIDVETFAPLLHQDLSSNPSFTLPRSLSRKGSGRSNNDRKINYDENGNAKETSIPHSPLRGSSTPEKSAVVGAHEGPIDLTAATSAAALAPPLHQITVTAGNISDQTERRFGFSKKTSFKRSPTFRVLDPKKVVLFFATLSSLGSILLIIITLCMSKSKEEDIKLD